LSNDRRLLYVEFLDRCSSHFYPQCQEVITAVYASISIVIVQTTVECQWKEWMCGSWCQFLSKCL